MNGATKLVGIVGWPLSYSLSPTMHNKAYEALGLNYSYVPLRVRPEKIDDLKLAINGIRACGFRGANVTIPYKQSIISYLDNISNTSMRASSVNTIWQDEDGILHGDTTDGSGFILDLISHGLGDIASMSISIIGAGGSAHAIALALLEKGCTRLLIHNRGLHKAEALAASANNLFPHTTKATGLDNFDYSDLVINCTPPNIIKNIIFKPNQIIYDTNYMHDALNFKTSSEKSGSRFISGIGMLLYSGALSFELFTGVKAPIDIMKKAL